MTELVLVASLGGIVALTFLYLRRSAEGEGARHWAWAWLALWASGLLVTFEPVHGAFAAAAAGLGVAFPAFLLSGAREHAGRPPLRWLPPAALAIGLLRAALRGLGPEASSYALALPCETGFVLAAAWTLGRRALPDPEASLPQKLLPPALVLVAGVLAADLLLRLRGSVPVGMIFAWVAAGFTVALLQIMAIVDRLREREHRLRRESERLSDIVERTSDPVGIADVRGRPSYLNPAARELLGLPAEGDPASLHLEELLPPEGSGPGAEGEGADDVRQGETTVLHRPSGARIPVSRVRIAQRDASGRITGHATILRDLSERVASERAARRKAREVALLRTLAVEALAHDGVAELLEAVIPPLRDQLGLDTGAVWLRGAEDGPLRLAQDFGHTPTHREEIAEPPAALALVRRALEERRPRFADDVTRDPDVAPDEVPVRAGLRALGLVPLVARGRVVGVLGVGRRRPEPFDAAERELLAAVGEELALALEHVRSIEARRHQAAELSAERRTLLALLDTAPVGVLLVDRSGEIRLVSRLAAEHYGGEPAPRVGQPFAELRRALLARTPDRERLEKEMARVASEPNGVVQDLELRLAGPEPRTLALFSGPVLADDGTRLGRVLVTRDVTHERRLEEELRQAQKMETLGTLAGGVAHDYNNLLTAVLGNARLALELAPEDPELRRALLDLERAGEHCAGLTRNLLAFARRAPVEPRPVEPRALLEEVAHLMRWGLPAGVELELDAPEGLPPALADPTQMQQVLLNLCVNARDALDRDPGGRIRVSAAACEVDARRAAGSPEARPGRYLELRVADDGPGLDGGLRERIFDPFFTTKPVGTGTGLGLAVAYGVVRSHGGWIEVESERGRGTTFRVLLPRAPEGARAPEAPAPEAPAAGGGETVLLADDEPLVRRLARATLERAGYAVVEAADGEEAVERFRERGPEGIDLVLLDVSMPRRDGEAALRAIRELAPGVPALLASGHFDPERRDFGAGVGLLAKPFRPAGLLARVRETLDAAASDASPGEA